MDSIRYESNKTLEIEIERERERERDAPFLFSIKKGK